MIGLLSTPYKCARQETIALRQPLTARWECEFWSSFKPPNCDSPVSIIRIWIRNMHATLQQDMIRYHLSQQSGPHGRLSATNMQLKRLSPLYQPLTVHYHAKHQLPRWSFSQESQFWKSVTLTHVQVYAQTSFLLPKASCLSLSFDCNEAFWKRVALNRSQMYFGLPLTEHSFFSNHDPPIFRVNKIMRRAQSKKKSVGLEHKKAIVAYLSEA